MTTSPTSGPPPATAIGALFDQWQQQGHRPDLAAAAHAGPLTVERAETAEEAAARRQEQDRHRARLWEQRIPVVHRDATLPTLIRPQQDPGGRVSSFLSGDRPVGLLVGPGRHGKTTCGVAIGNQVRRRGGVCAYWEAPELRMVLCDDDKHDSGELAARRRAAVRELETADYVMLDDLGAEQRDKPWGPWTEWLWRILTTRAENGRLLVITMNGVNDQGEAITDQYGPEGELLVSKDIAVAQMLERRYGTRVARRILDYCLAVWVEGRPLEPPALRSLFGGGE